MEEQEKLTHGMHQVHRKKIRQGFLELPLDKLKSNIQDIVSQCKEPLLQLSGGEPTLRDDLPELVKFAKKAGCSYVQINTNGIRLATDEAYVKALAEAGTDIIFLQFDE